MIDLLATNVFRHAMEDNLVRFIFHLQLALVLLSLWFGAKGAAMLQAEMAPTADPEPEA